jgi:hypothetical protein
MKSRLARIAATLALALLLNGCVPIDSLFPLYKADDAVFDDRWLGPWQPVATDDSDKDERWYLSHSEGDEFYDVRWGATGTKGGFFARARLTRLANNLFIDFEGDSKKIGDPHMDGSVPFPVIATHMIGRIWLEKDAMQIHFLDDEWVKKQTQAGTFSLAHLNLDRDQILTAQTQDVRQFVQAHADDAEALSVIYKLIRTK